MLETLGLTLLSILLFPLVILICWVLPIFILGLIFKALGHCPKRDF